MSASTTKIPKLMLPLAFAFTIPMAGIAASTNWETLIEFGIKLYGPRLAASLPLATIGYELFASIIYFTLPDGLPRIKKSAATGALVGFGSTILLAVLWVLVDGGVLPGGLWLKIVMKPVPGIITAGFIHILVLVWHAHKASKEAAAAPKEARVEVVMPPAGPSPEELAAMVTAAVAAQVEAALSVATARLAADVAAMLPKTPPAPRRTVSRRAPDAAAKLAAAPISAPTSAPDPAEDAELAALEAQLALDDTPAAADLLRDLKPPTTRVSEAHIERARQLRKEMRAAGSDPDDKEHGLKSGQLKNSFGLADRTMRAVLEWARYRDELDLVAAA